MEGRIGPPRRTVPCSAERAARRTTVQDNAKHDPCQGEVTRFLASRCVRGRDESCGGRDAEQRGQFRTPHASPSTGRNSGDKGVLHPARLSAGWRLRLGARKPARRPNGHGPGACQPTQWESWRLHSASGRKERPSVGPVAPASPVSRDMPRRAWAEHPRLRDDGIIDPADTRRVPALAIAASINAAFPQRKVREFRM